MKLDRRAREQANLGSNVEARGVRANLAAVNIARLAYRLLLQKNVRFLSERRRHN